MLVLTRKEDEAVEIHLAKDLPPDLLARDLFRYGPIKLVVISHGYRGTKIGIDAPDELQILRSELLRR